MSRFSNNTNRNLRVEGRPYNILLAAGALAEYQPPPGARNAQPLASSVPGLTDGSFILHALEWMVQVKDSSTFDPIPGGRYVEMSKHARWQSISQLLEKELDWVIPQKRKELLQLGDAAEALLLIDQVDHQLEISPSIPSSLLQRRAPTSSHHEQLKQPPSQTNQHVTKPVAASKPQPRVVHRGPTNTSPPPVVEAEHSKSTEEMQRQLATMLRFQKMQQQMLLRYMAVANNDIVDPFSGEGNRRNPKSAVRPIAKSTLPSKATPRGIEQAPKPKAPVSDSRSLFDAREEEFVLDAPVLRGKAKVYKKSGIQKSQRKEEGIFGGPAESNMADAVALRLQLREREDELARRHREEQALHERLGIADDEEQVEMARVTLLQCTLWVQAALLCRHTAVAYHAQLKRFRSCRLIQCFVRYRRVRILSVGMDMEPPHLERYGCDRCAPILQVLVRRIGVNPLAPRKVRHKYCAAVCEDCTGFVVDIVSGAGL